MVNRILAEVPAYRRAPRGVLDDVLELSAETARIIGEAIAAAVPVQRQDVPIVREHAARRIAQGVTLDAFLHAYRAALFYYWDVCMADAAALSRDEAIALGRFVLDAIDTITSHAAEAYLREETRQRLQSGREARDLLERLIRGAAIETDRRHAAAPGLDPRGLLQVVVGLADGLEAARDALEQSLSLGKARPLVAIRQREVVIVAPAGSLVERVRIARRRARQEPGVDVRCGISQACEGFAGVARAYREAALALSYTSDARPIVSLGDLSSLDIALLGADAATRAAIAAKGGTHAVELVRAFAAADMNVARAAEALRVHPNTVRYRLERVLRGDGDRSADVRRARRVAVRRRGQRRLSATR